MPMQPQGTPELDIVCKMLVFGDLSTCFARLQSTLQCSAHGHKMCQLHPWTNSLSSHQIPCTSKVRLITTAAGPNAL